MQKAMVLSNHPGAKNLVVARVYAFKCGDMVAVSSIDTTIAQRQTTDRAARYLKKPRKPAVAAQMLNYAFQNRTTDPLPDDERS